MDVIAIAAILLTILLGVGGVGVWVRNRLFRIEAVVKDGQELQKEVLDVIQVAIQAASDGQITAAELQAIVEEAKQTEQPFRDFINSLKAVFAANLKASAK